MPHQVRTVPSDGGIIFFGLCPSSRGARHSPYAHRRRHIRRWEVKSSHLGLSDPRLPYPAGAGSRSAQATGYPAVPTAGPADSTATNGRRYIPRLALTRAEAADAIGMSVDSFDRYVQPHIRLIRKGKLRVVPVAELERWLVNNAEALT